MSDCIRILLVEDVPTDVEIALRAIKRDNISFIERIVDNETDFSTALIDFSPDIVISDYYMPLFDGMGALKITRAHSESLPFILLTGSINEETAVSCMKAGANDYVLKEHIDRLPVAIMEAIKNSKIRIEKEEMQKQIAKSSARFKSIMSSMQDLVYTFDKKQKITEFFGRGLQNLGLEADEFLGKRFGQFLNKEEAQLDDEASKRAIEGDFADYEWSALRDDKKFYFHTSLSPVLNGEGVVESVVGVARDITESKEITEALRISEERFRVALSNAPIVVYCQDKNLCFTWMYNPHPEFYMDSIIGKMDEDILSSEDALHLREIKIKVLESGKGSQKEVKINLRGKPFYYQLITEPLMDLEGNVIGVRCAAIDITELRRYQKQLQKTINGSIETIARISEIRDPYTAGHQKRVSQLSVSIAQVMGLAKNRIQSIRISSIIHDIGKIGIPSEILTKPGKLSEMEYNLIKNHPQIGYDILKEVDFAYPIAQIILQHHERMDGSGYPNGLKGEEIMIEARIIAVADVVEAMSSFRPYRPALGIEAALKEIDRYRGSLFDEGAVDACIRLFREKDFQFVDEPS